MSSRRNAIAFCVVLVLAAACGKKEEKTAVQGTEAAPAAAAPAQPAANCALITAAEVQEATGQPATGPTVNGTNSTVCEFKVSEAGVLNFYSKRARADETPDAMMAELTKRNIPVAEHAGLGDRSFFASPGYGMTQLNSFKGPDYVIVTLLVPGLGEAKQKEVAAKVMAKALSRL